MSNKVLEFIIRAKDATGAGINAAREKFHGLSGKVTGGLKNMMTSMAAFVGVSIGVGAAVKGLTTAISTAFEFERYETQFKVLFGSLEKAKTHIAELQAFSAATPFQFGDIAQASRTLIVMTNGVMGAKESLTLVGDAAAAVGTNFGELSTWVGRAYGAIKSGRPFGEAAQRLMELGIITPDVRAEMEKMQEEGKSNIEVWNKLQEALERYKGGMDELSKTGEGLFSTLKDNWKLAVAEFGKAFMDVAKDNITSLTDKLKELRENGDIAVWADRAKTVLEGIATTIKGVTKVLGFLYKWSGASDIVAGVKGISAAVGSLSTGDIKGAGRNFLKERAKGNYGSIENKLIGDPLGVAAENEKEAADKKAREEKIREASKQKNAETAKKESETKEGLAKKIIEDMAASQKKIDEENAKKKAEEEKKAREKIEKELAEQRAQQQRALIEEEKRLKRDALAALGDQQQAQQDRLARAEQAVAQSWAEYKDPKLFTARKEAEEQDKKFQEQFEKDRKRVEFKVASRMQLTEQEQAAQRVMQARAEEEAAKKALVDIAKNTEETKKLLEELLRMK